MTSEDPNSRINWICDDSLERPYSTPTKFSLAELKEKVRTNATMNNTAELNAIIPLLDRENFTKENGRAMRYTDLTDDQFDRYWDASLADWLKSSMSSYHRDIEGCTSAYHEEDCVSISGLQTVVIPATGYTRVSLGTNQPYEPPTEPPTEEPTEEPKITAPTGVKYEVTSSGSVDYEKIITYNLAYTTEKNKVCRGTKFDAKEDGLTNTSFGMEHSIEYIGDGKARLSIDLDPAFIKENIKKNGYLELEIKFASKSSTVPILGVYADGTTSGTVTQDIILNKVSDTYPKIKVSWNKVPNADSYSVYVIGGTTTVNGQNLMKYFTDLKTTSCSFTITEQYASSFFVGNIGKPWYCNEFTIYVAATRGKQSVSTSKTFAYSEVNRPYNANDPYVYVDRVVEWK